MSILFFMCTFEYNRNQNQYFVIHMKLNKYIVYTIVLSMFFLLEMTSTASAQNRTQLEKEKQKIENEIRKLNKDLSATRKGKTLSNSQLKKLNQKLLLLI